MYSFRTGLFLNVEIIYTWEKLDFIFLLNFFPIKACTGQKRVKETQGGGSSSKKQKRSHKATVVNNKKKGKGSKCEISVFKYKDDSRYVFFQQRKGYSGYGIVQYLILSPPPPQKSHRSLGHR